MKIWKQAISSPVEPKPKHRALYQVLFHHILKYGNNPVHWNGGEGHAKDPIKFGCYEFESNLFCGLSKELILYYDIANLEGRGQRWVEVGSRSNKAWGKGTRDQQKCLVYLDRVLTDGSHKTPRNGERRAIFPICGRLWTVILLVSSYKCKYNITYLLIS